MPPRFHVPPPALDADPAGRVTLTGPEAKHLAAVLRLRAGDAVTLFDGAGRRAGGTIREVTGKGAKTAATVACGPVTLTPPDPHPLTLAVAPPKGDRFRWLIEKATELGVAAVVPLLCGRSTVDPSGGKLDKLRATALAACKQCGRDRLPTLTGPVSLAEFLTRPGLKTLLHVTGDPPPAAVPPGPHAVLIGPEGGFEDAEVDAARAAGAAVASLPTPILRTETAALTAAAIFAMRRQGS